MKKLAILISKSGKATNLSTISNSINGKKLNANIACIICDGENEIARNIANKNHIPFEICNNKKNLLALLIKCEPNIIILAGWKQIIPEEVIDHYKNKILNLHPGIIPDKYNGVSRNPDGSNALWNRGKYAEQAIEEFIKNNSTYAGSSVHFLSKKFDFGKVLGKTFEKIRNGDTIETLYARLKKKENFMYLEVLKKLCN